MYPHSFSIKATLDLSHDIFGLRFYNKFQPDVTILFSVATCLQKGKLTMVEGS
jgi:hypothetical protein